MRALLTLTLLACAPRPASSPPGEAPAPAPAAAATSSACPCPDAGPTASASAKADPPAATDRPAPPAGADSPGVAEMLRERDADGHLATASEKLRARDGKACLAELDRHDELDKRPQHRSTRPESSVSMLRGECLMLAGRCDDGKALLRRAYPGQSPTPIGPEQLETMLDALGTQFCEGVLSPRDQLLKAASELQRGSATKVDAATCAKSYDTVKRLAQTVRPRSDDDGLVKNATSPFTQGYAAASCLGRAGDCAASRRAYDEAMGALYQGKAAMSAAQAKESFERVVPSCKGK